MADKDFTRIAEDFITAFNTADWHAFKALLAPNVHYEETGTQRRVDDADAYAQLAQGWKEAFPDGNGMIRQVVARGNTVVQEITWQGTHTRPLITPTRRIVGSSRTTVRSSGPSTWR